MSEQQYVYDDGDLRKYRTEIPNMADDELDPYQYRLYAHYKRVGQCWESVSTTADKCRMSRTKVIETRNWLHENGWIAVEHRDNTTCMVKVLDRWGENFLRYTKTEPQHSSPNMDYPGPNMDYPGPNMDSKKEPIKKEPIKKVDGPPPQKLGQRQQRQTPEHLKVARTFGLEPRDMTRLVNAVLDATGKRHIADLETTFGERELSYAQECAVSLIQMGVHEPEQVAAAVKAFENEYPRYGTPSYRQLLEAAGKTKQKAERPLPPGSKRNADGSITTAFVPPVPAYAS